MRADRRRSAAFAIASLALLLAAIHFAGRGAAPSSLQTTAPPDARSRAFRPAPHLDPRSFLRAFLRYELGETDPALRRKLRATTTPAFGAQLLASPVRVPNSPLPPARIDQLRVTRLSDNPPRALVSGVALRSGSPEQFSFLFEAHNRAWLAAGPGE